MKQVLIASALTGMLLLPVGLAVAADQDRTQDRTQMQDRDRIYGSELMSPQERADYRDRLRSAKSAQERARIRQEHHERMRERARDRGVTLPNSPPARPGGMAPGGGGMGPGGGGMMSPDNDSMQGGGSGGGGRGR